MVAVSSYLIIHPHFGSSIYDLVWPRKWPAHVQWFGTAKNWDKSTGPRALPFAHLLAPLTHFLAPHCSLRSSAPLRLSVCSLTHSLLSSGKSQWLDVSKWSGLVPQWHDRLSLANNRTFSYWCLTAIKSQCCVSTQWIFHLMLFSYTSRQFELRREWPMAANSQIWRGMFR